MSLALLQLKLWPIVVKTNEGSQARMQKNGNGRLRRFICLEVRLKVLAYFIYIIVESPAKTSHAWEKSHKAQRLPCTKESPGARGAGLPTWEGGRRLTTTTPLASDHVVFRVRRSCRLPIWSQTGCQRQGVSSCQLPATHGTVPPHLDISRPISIPPFLPLSRSRHL